MAEPLGEFSQPQDDELVKALAKIMGGMFPVAGEAIDAADMAEAIRNDDKEEMALIGAGAALPFVTPQMLRVAKGIPEAFAQLPDSAFKRLTYELLQRGDLTLQEIKGMFNDAGDLLGFHGTGGPIEEFTTAQGDALMGSNTDMWGGPGLYQGHGSLQSPIEIGEMATDASYSPVAIHEIVTPRDDITGLAGHNFMSSPEGFRGQIEFGDQSERVKDSLSTLYPDVSDARRQQLYDVSPYATSEPYSVAGIHGVDPMDKPAFASESAQNISDYDIRMDGIQHWDGDMPRIRQQASDAGLAGNIHVEGQYNPRMASVNFDPDRTHVEGVDMAMVNEWNTARGGSSGMEAPAVEVFDKMDLDPDPGNPRIRRSPEAKSNEMVWGNYEQLWLEPRFMRDTQIDELMHSGEKVQSEAAYQLREIDFDEDPWSNDWIPEKVKDDMAKYDQSGDVQLDIKLQNRDRLNDIYDELEQLDPYPGSGLEEMIELVDEAIKMDPAAAEKLIELFDIIPEDVPDF